MNAVWTWRIRGALPCRPGRLAPTPRWAAWRSGWHDTSAATPKSLSAARRAPRLIWQHCAERLRPRSRTHSPGLVIHARRDAAGALICYLALRALGEVAVLGIRPGLLEADRRAAD